MTKILDIDKSLRQCIRLRFFAISISTN